MIRRDNWTRTRLKYVAECNAAVLDEHTEDDHEFIYVDVTSVSQGAMTVEPTPIRFGDAPSRARRLAEPGDTVVSTVRTYLRAVATVPETDELLVFSTAFAVLHPRKGIYPRFLSWYLQGDEFVSRVEANSVGVSYPAITATDLIALDLRLPELDEQQAIADFLDRETVKIDTLIEEQQRLIELLHERRQVIIDGLVAGSPECRRMALKFALADVDQGVSPQAEAGLAEEPGSWGVLKSGCVNHGVFRQEEHKRLPTDFDVTHLRAVSVGDVIVSRASGSPDLVGSCAIVERADFRLILSDKLFRLVPSPDTDPRFLMWHLNGQRYRHHVRRSISGAEGLANNLPLRALLGFEMFLPSLEEQRRIVAHLDEQVAKIDLLIAETWRFIELSKERQAALITAAVTGQIDVREKVGTGVA